MVLTPLRMVWSSGLLERASGGTVAGYRGATLCKGCAKPVCGLEQREYIVWKGDFAAMCRQPETDSGVVAGFFLVRFTAAL